LFRLVDVPDAELAPSVAVDADPWLLELLVCLPVPPDPLLLDPELAEPVPTDPVLFDVLLESLAELPACGVSA
jgi:hypothetical protein